MSTFVYWLENYQILSRAAKHRKSSCGSDLFSRDHTHQDGALAVLGKGNRTAFLVAISFGPIDDDSLRSFLTGMRHDFPLVQIVGNCHLQPPWHAIGALPASNRLSRAEKEDLEERLEILLGNLKERISPAQKIH